MVEQLESSTTLLQQVDSTYSVYGASGTIGSYLCSSYPKTMQFLERNEVYPFTDSKCIYLISTNSNTITGAHDVNRHINTNLTILIDRLYACQEIGIKEFNFISSWFVYGPPTFNTSTYSNGAVHIPVFKESDWCNPKGFYSITKRTAEEIVREFCEYYGIKWRILRLSNVYGFDPSASKNKNALHYLIRQLQSNEDVTLYGYYRAVIRDYIHIHDACRAIKHVCDNAPFQNIYNIGSGPTRAVELDQVMERAKAYCDSTSNIEFISKTAQELPHHIEAASLSIDKLTTTGFKPTIPFDTGLKYLCTCGEPKTADQAVQTFKTLVDYL